MTLNKLPITRTKNNVGHTNPSIIPMRRTLTFSALALAAICILWACSSDNPASIAEKFLSAMAVGDYAAAKQYASKDSQAALDMLIQNPEAQTLEEIEIEVDKEEITGDQASVTYLENGRPKTLLLIKEDQQWRVAFSKTDIEGDPKEVGESFLYYLSVGEVELAKKFATRNSQSILDHLQPDQAFESGHLVGFNLDPKLLPDGRAEDHYRDGNGHKWIYLVKEDHRWKVDWTISGVERRSSY